ncbi:GTPase-associated system all-helical protein GASH [Vibrio splendidus]
MATDILLRFLSAGLIDVGGDDTKLEKLLNTSSDLTALLKKNPSKSSSFALVAFDPKAPENDPVIEEAEKILQKRWTTYVNTFSGTPVTVIRAVILDSLFKAATEDDNLGVAFVSAARNTLPYMEVGNESEIWVDVITSIENQVNVRAESEWSTPESINVPKLKYSAPTALEIRSLDSTIDRDTLKTEIDEACGPTNPEGQATGGNTVWPNSHQGWCNQFSPRMVAAIGNAIESAQEGYHIAPVDLSTPLQDLANAVSIHVDATLKSISGATAGLQRRTNLIWWKETLYSPSARISYRDLSPSMAAALMAFDLHHQVPTFSPSSVAAFLYETVLSLPTIDIDKKFSISELVKETQQAEELSILRYAAGELITENTGRGLILGILANDLNPSIDDEELRGLVGIPPDTKLSASQWATWIFRELQAARALKESVETKKRGRKAK